MIYTYVYIYIAILEPPLRRLGLCSFRPGLRGASSHQWRSQSFTWGCLEGGCDRCSGLFTVIRSDFMTTTPRKINIEPENDSLEDVFLSKWIHVNLPGCTGSYLAVFCRHFFGVWPANAAAPQASTCCERMWRPRRNRNLWGCKWTRVFWLGLVHNLRWESSELYSFCFFFFFLKSVVLFEEVLFMM